MKYAWMAATVLLGSVGTAAASPPHGVSEAQAEALVKAALSPQQRSLPGLEVIANDAPGSSGFLFFMAIWKGEASGSVVVGNYAVDPNTGDVFSATRECDEMKTSQLAALQAGTRLALGLSASAYRRIKTKGPLCG